MGVRGKVGAAVTEQFAAAHPIDASAHAPAVPAEAPGVRVVQREVLAGSLTGPNAVVDGPEVGIERPDDVHTAFEARLATLQAGSDRLRRVGRRADHVELVDERRGQGALDRAAEHGSFLGVPVHLEARRGKLGFVHVKVAEEQTEVAHMDGGIVPDQGVDALDVGRQHEGGAELGAVGHREDRVDLHVYLAHGD